MKSTVRWSWAISMLLAVSFSPGGASWVEAPRAHVILKPNAPGTILEFRDELVAAGGHAAIVYPPRTAVVYAHPEVLASLSPWIAAADHAEIDLVDLAAEDANVLRSARVWNRFLKMRAAPPTQSPGRHDRPMPPDAGPLPVTLPAAPVTFRDAPTHIPYGAQYYDTSTYAAGSSAVGVWLLEASGATYDWSVAEETETLAGVQSGLDYWVTHGGTRAFLSFVAEIHTGVPVSGVPIENPQSWDDVWMEEVLSNEGYAGANAFERCFNYNNTIRDTYETNWCFSLVIVDSDPAVNQGLFDGGGYAWAYYGGPWIYMSRFSTWAFNSGNYFEAVPMHEMGHIYFATDEYDGFQQFQGYLNQADTQSSTVNCLMNRNVEWRICVPTKRQIAWRDADGDDVMEPLDVDPDALLDELLPDPTANPTPTWTGTANVNTIPNLNPAAPYFPPHDITVATITSVECRVDGGAWTAATPTDGTFDAYVEDFSWSSPPLADGVHVVEARAQTSVGIWTSIYDSDTITVNGSPVGVGDVQVVARQPTLYPNEPNPLRSDTVIRFSLPQNGRVQIEVFAVDGSRVRTLVNEERIGGCEPRGVGRPQRRGAAGTVGRLPLPPGDGRGRRDAQAHRQALNSSGRGRPRCKPGASRTGPALCIITTDGRIAGG